MIQETDRSEAEVVGVHEDAADQHTTLQYIIPLGRRIQ